jgi:hypothetical protein
MLPNLVVIGAAKSGTTSLHSYLDLHPQISMSPTKELNFFVLEKNWPKGVEWYESNFVSSDETRILGESSPSYTQYPVFKGVPERMHLVLPEAKLIYILRDPIERIISHYVHNYRRRVENRSISEVLTDLENNPYVLWSKYYTQLEQYLDHFPQSSILIITLEDLRRYRQQTLQKVFRFLGVDDSFWSQGFSSILYTSSGKRRRNQIGLLCSRMPGKGIIKSLLPSSFVKVYRSLSSSKVNRPVLSTRLEQALIDVLKDDIDCLRKYTGSDFDAWCL